MPASDPLRELPDQPRFTDADVALVEEAIRREAKRIALVCEVRGIVTEPDDHTGRLRDLAKRLRRYIRR